jgi:hypothetical protein
MHDGRLHIDHDDYEIDPGFQDFRDDVVPSHWRLLPLGPDGESLG